MQQLLIIIHVLAAIGIISLVLLQHGKGADVGAAFGSGASTTMFGSQGAIPFLMKFTIILATIFFITSISLSYLASREQRATFQIPQQQPVTPQNIVPQKQQQDGKMQPEKQNKTGNNKSN